MTRMLYSWRCSIAQSIASITSLASPDPSSPSTRRLRRYAPGAMPRWSRVSAVRPARPAMMPATCVPWPNRSMPSPPVKSFVTSTRRRSAACRVSIPESITATETPGARQRRQVVEPGPDLVDADALGRHRVDRRLQPDVARQMILRLVLPQRLELTGVDEEHRAALQIAGDPEVVARRERVHLRPLAVHDHPDGLRADPQVVGQVVADPRPMVAAAAAAGARREQDRRKNARPGAGDRGRRGRGAALLGAAAAQPSAAATCAERPR